MSEHKSRSRTASVGRLALVWFNIGNLGATIFKILKIQWLRVLGFEIL